MSDANREDGENANDKVSTPPLPPPLALESAARVVADLLVGKISIQIPWQDKESIEEQKTELVKELVEADIDPLVFDALLSNEIDRKLKVRFGVAFLILSVLFTVASYLIVIFDSIQGWGISDIAITALIIETPIQFIGLLYIIARNLFPQSDGDDIPLGKMSS